MRNIRIVLLPTDGACRSPATFKTRAELLPEGNGVREGIPTYLETVESRVDGEIAAPRRTIEETQRR